MTEPVQEPITGAEYRDGDAATPRGALAQFYAAFNAGDLKLMAANWHTGADAVMIGRGTQGRPWFPGQVARFLATGERAPAPPLAEQFAIITALYEELIDHHGVSIGRRHARKHLGWALDQAADTAGVPQERLKAHRTRVLTAEQPAQALRLIAEAYDDFAWRAAA